MNGRTHRYIAFVIVTLVLALLSAFMTEGFWIPIAIFALMGLSIILYGRAAALQTKKDDFEKQSILQKVVKDLDNIAKFERMNWIHKKTEATAWFLLLFNMIFTTITADFLPDLHRGVSIGLALLIIPIVGIAGSFISDWDWDWGPEFHRNPLFHSYFIPFSIWVFGMIVFPYEFRYLNLITGTFCLAFATHLFADCVPETTTGLWNILRDFFNFNQSPGDIRHIPEQWEHKWLAGSGVILLGCFGISLPRMYGSVGFDWAGVNAEGMLIWSFQILILMILAVVGIAAWFVLYVKGVFLEKKPQKNKRKEKLASTSQPIIPTDKIVLDQQLPQIKQEVEKIFQVQPVISTRAMLFKALEKASHDIPVEEVYNRLKLDKFIIFNRSAPAGFKLGTKNLL